MTTPATHDAPATPTRRVPRIVILGGGYVGLYTALRLRRRLSRRDVAITLVDPRSYMTYQPFLPEAAAGSLEPRHVVVAHRQVLRDVDVLNARVTQIRHADRVVRVAPEVGPAYDLAYDHLVVALGSVSRTLPIPGLAEEGIGFKTVEEAIHLRNQVLGQLDLAVSTRDPRVRRRALTFVFVGGGYAGVEALAELQDMAYGACKYFPTVEPSDMRWVLVEATGRILPEVGEDMGRWTLQQLRAGGIDVRLETRLVSAENRHIVLDDGDEFDAGTLVWTAGVRPNPLVRASDLPRDEKDRVKVTPRLNVEGMREVFSAGDCAAVPDLTRPGQYCGPSAQHAVRQARTMADNIVATLRREPLRDYRHAYAGSVATLGLHKGVAQVRGVKVRGFPAWFIHRAYHLSRVPTLNRKVRVVVDWTLALFFPRDITSLGALSEPRKEFESAARPFGVAGDDREGEKVREPASARAE